MGFMLKRRANNVNSFVEHWINHTRDVCHPLSWCLWTLRVRCVGTGQTAGRVTWEEASDAAHKHIVHLGATETDNIGGQPAQTQRAATQREREHQHTHNIICRSNNSSLDRTHGTRETSTSLSVHARYDNIDKDPSPPRGMESGRAPAARLKCQTARASELLCARRRDEEFVCVWHLAPCQTHPYLTRMNEFTLAPRADMFWSRVTEFLSTSADLSPVPMTLSRRVCIVRWDATGTTARNIKASPDIWWRADDEDMTFGSKIKVSEQPREERSINVFCSSGYFNRCFGIFTIKCVRNNLNNDIYLPQF